MDCDSVLVDNLRDKGNQLVMGLSCSWFKLFLLIQGRSSFFLFLLWIVGINCFPWTRPERAFILWVDDPNSVSTRGPLLVGMAGLTIWTNSPYNTKKHMPVTVSLRFESCHICHIWECLRRFQTIQSISYHYRYVVAKIYFSMHIKTECSQYLEK